MEAPLETAVTESFYDRDFNQILDLAINSGAPFHIRDFEYERLSKREIVVR